ncbi:MAG: hypothetical protein LBI41_01030 [Lactobacillales bacterium]|jgi:hypothetical protein|nr:hypothetical protein [Lactobacillales bacterium]
MADYPKLPESMNKVIESAAKLQSLVPGAILVGGSAALEPVNDLGAMNALAIFSYFFVKKPRFRTTKPTFFALNYEKIARKFISLEIVNRLLVHAGHRYSINHDHVVNDLDQRFNIIFDAVASDRGWSTFQAVQDKIILGRLDGVEAGIRQLRRKAPLETEIYHLDNEHKVVIPTIEETLRVKAYFIVNRNQVRDYLDVIAITDRFGIKGSTEVLLEIDSYYEDMQKYENSISSELIERLSDPNPKDSRSIPQLKTYKGLKESYTNWEYLTQKSKKLAKEMIINA